MQPCANCGQAFDSAFCPACGQKRSHPGIKLGEVIGDFASGIFNVDAPILRTFREYIVGPGKLTRAFLAGKRKAYTPPVRYFLFGVAFSGADSKPVTVGLNNMANTTSSVKSYNVDMAAAIIAGLPTMLVYVLAGQYFVKGLTAGAVKG